MQTPSRNTLSKLGLLGTKYVDTHLGSTCDLCANLDITSRTTRKGLLKKSSIYFSKHLEAMTRFCARYWIAICKPLPV